MRRILYVSAHGIDQDSPVDIFRIKWLIEDAIRRSGVPYVIPVFAMTLLPPVVRMFDELAARLMTLGYFATIERPFPGWKQAANRFGVRPRTLEEHIARVT